MTRLAFTSRLFSGLLCLGLLANCAVNPVTGRQNFVMMSESGEVRTNRNAEGYLRLMNHASPSGEPQAGQHLKMVE